MASDQFVDNKSDKRCLLKSNILIVCSLGTIAEISKQTLDIVLTHHALGEVNNQYTLQQAGTDPNLENNNVLVNTPLHQAKITMDMGASQRKVNTDGTVNIDITLKNHEATTIVSSFLQLRFPSQVKFEGDSCSYRWYIDNIEQGDAKTIKPIAIDHLNDGHHQLKVELLHLDGTATDTSIQADFTIFNPVIQITGSEVYSSEFSTVSLNYTIDGWQWQDKRIPHHIIINANEDEAIYKTDTKPFVLKKLKKDNSIIEIKLVTPDGERTTISQTTQFKYSDAVITDRSPQTKKMVPLSNHTTYSYCC